MKEKLSWNIEKQNKSPEVTSESLLANIDGIWEEDKSEISELLRQIEKEGGDTKKARAILENATMKLSAVSRKERMSLVGVLEEKEHPNTSLDRLSFV